VKRGRTARNLDEPEGYAAARAGAFDDARALALEISRGIPSRRFDAMGAGLVLGSSETAYRWVGAWLTAQDCGSWAPPNWAQVLITDERLLCGFDDGRLVSLRWTEVGGVQIRLEQQSLLLSCGNHSPIRFVGAGTAAIAVAAVSMLYGPGALLTHRALTPLRHDSTHEMP
jgi:hypothetical protein